MTTDQTYSGYEDMPPIAKKPPWKIIVGIVIAAVLFMGMCLAGVAILGGNRPLPKDPVIPAFDNSPRANTSTETQPTVVIPRGPILVKGKGNAVVQVGHTLNGAFTVEYAFGSWCGIVHFLKANGSNGTELLETINDCAADTNAKAAGSTVVHLTNVTMVKVENTSGNWSLNFVPLG